MARTFNDLTTNNIRTSIATPHDIAFGSFALIMKRNSTEWNGLVGLHTSGGSARLNLEIQGNANGNFLVVQNEITDVPSPFTVTNADGWVLLVVSKGTAAIAGTALMTWWKYVYSSDTWNYEPPVGTGPSDGGLPGTSGTIRFGQWETGDFLGGDLAVAGMWNRVLIDAEVRGMPFDLAAWHASGPVGLWVFDQSETTHNLADLTGNGADQSAITATTVSTNSVPVFNYGLGPSVALVEAGPPALTGALIGSAAAGAQLVGVGPQIARPTATVSDGGWTTELGGTDLHLSVDERVANTADYIQSPTTPSGDAARLSLESVATPGAGPRWLAYSYRKTVVGGVQEDLLVELLQGETVVQSWEHEDIGASDTTVVQEITAAITDYSQLDVRLTATEVP